MQFLVNRKPQEEIGYNLNGRDITHQSELFKPKNLWYLFGEIKFTKKGIDVGSNFEGESWEGHQGMLCGGRYRHNYLIQSLKEDASSNK